VSVKQTNRKKQQRNNSITSTNIKKGTDRDFYSQVELKSKMKKKVFKLGIQNGTMKDFFVLPTFCPEGPTIFGQKSFIVMPSVTLNSIYFPIVFNHHGRVC
jgi:hypothetical protein